MLQTPYNSDLVWMRRALGLAAEARGLVWPNPPVGCVIVKESAVVAEAATHKGGRPHAEKKALDQAGASAKGATLYVTLEPCCHWGKTPPCADAIIEAAVSRVVCATRDPDPRVNGGGFEKLRHAGVELTVGLCAEAAINLMSGFFHRIQTGFPELVAFDQTSDCVPVGTDGVLVSNDLGAELTTRLGKERFVAQSIEHLMQQLGDFGLTTVAIPKADPLWLKAVLLPSVMECTATKR